MRVRYNGETDCSLTNGKMYDVISVQYWSYQIIDDSGESYFFPEEEFDVVEE